MTTFDGDNLLIILDTGLDAGTLDVLDDLYEPWKDWVLLGNAQYPAAFRPSGGDPLTPGVAAGSYTFLRNDYGWRIRPAEEDASFIVTGNLAPEDSTLPIMVPTVGDFTVLAQGLQPITQNVAELLTLQQDSQFGDSVWINAFTGAAGTAHPIGTPVEPVSNLADAITIAARLGVNHLKLHGVIQLTQAHTSWVFEGVGGIASVDINGQDVSGSLFMGCGVEGTCGTITLPVVIQAGQINSAGLDNFAGSIAQCTLVGNVSTVSDTNLFQCASGIPGTAHPHIDLQNLPADIGIRDYSGGIGVENVNDAVNVSVDLLSGHFELESSVTAGTFVVRGVGHLTDNSTGTTLVVDGLVQGVKVSELHQLQGLELGAPMTVSDTQRAVSAAGIDLDVNDNGTTTTVTRQ